MVWGQRVRGQGGGRSESVGNDGVDSSLAVATNGEGGARWLQTETLEGSRRTCMVYLYGKFYGIFCMVTW